MALKTKAEHWRRHWVTGCPSGKRGYPERRGAKDVARQLAKVGDDKPRAYRCDQCPYWHVGHKPAAVMRGEVSAKDWYDR